jgi:hypothetical protein
MVRSNTTPHTVDQHEDAHSVLDGALLTQEEAIRLLRLDALSLRHPKEALRHLRRTGQIGYVKVCGKILIPRKAVEDYLRRHLVNVAEPPLD